MLRVRICYSLFFSLSLILAATTQAQTAYFSLVGDYMFFGDQHNFNFDLSRPVDSTEVLRFQTFAEFGGTNAAGQMIPRGGINSVIELFDSAGQSRGINDDFSVSTNAGDSLLSWANVPLPNPAGAQTFINPDPLAAGNFRVNLSETVGEGVGLPWAIDLVGPADAFTFSGQSVVGGSTVDSLEFGTTGAGTNPATIALAGEPLNVIDRVSVGHSGSGSLRITAGGQLTSGRADVGSEFAFSSGAVEVAGSDALGNRSSWISSGTIDVGDSSSTGSLRISDGGLVSSNRLRKGVGSVIVSGRDDAGNPSTLTASTSILLEDTGGLFLIEDGGIASARFSTVASSSLSDATMTVTGSDASGNPSELRIAESLIVGRASQGKGVLNVTNGGLVSNTDGNIASVEESDGVVNVNGADSFGNLATWNLAGDLDIGLTFIPGGSRESGELNIGVGGVVRVAGVTNLVWQTSSINLSGGRFEFGSTTFEEYSRFNATSGALAGLVEISGVNTMAGLTGLVARNNVDTIGISVANAGRISGAGTFAGNVTNLTTGELEVITGERMLFQGPNSTNSGQITLGGGQVEFAQRFTNEASGIVLGNGTLRANTALTNDGTMAFTSSNTVLANVIGDITNNTGGLITSSGGTLTFFDDVINNGEIRTNANSATVFFGAVSGTGNYTETGTVIFEGSFSPGASPSVIEFGGNVGLSEETDLSIELGGYGAGAFDKLVIDGVASLAGDLNVSLLDNFTPGLGDRFEIVTAQGVVGTFASLVAPDGVPGIELQYAPTGVSLLVTSALSGDYNNDGSVDLADYSVWRNNLGAPAGTLLNDTPGGAIGTAQYYAWRANYGATLHSQTPAMPVPEPSAALLAIGGGAFLLARRRSILELGSSVSGLAL